MGGGAPLLTPVLQVALAPTFPLPTSLQVSALKLVFCLPLLMGIMLHSLSGSLILSLRAPPHHHHHNHRQRQHPYAGSVRLCGGWEFPRLLLATRKADGAAPAGKPTLIRQDNGPLQAGPGLPCPAPWKPSITPPRTEDVATCACPSAHADTQMLPGASRP